MSRLFIFSLILGTFPLITSIMLKVNGKKDKYCFAYSIFTKSEIKISYSVSSEKQEKFIVNVTRNNSTILYNQTHLAINRHHRVANKTAQKGKTDFIVEDGRIELCLTPLDKSEYFFAFDFIISFGNEKVANLGTDESMKKILGEVKQIRTSFDEIEKTLKRKTNEKFANVKIMRSISKNIKSLTILKLLIYLCISLLQAYIIMKFFGPDKRVKSVQGAFTDGL